MALAEVALVASNHYPSHREFNVRTAYIASQYGDHLLGMDCGRSRKITLVAAHEPTGDAFVAELQVATLTRFFDFASYWSAPRRAQQEMVLRFLVDGCQVVAAHEGWSPQAFVEAGARVQEGDFSFGRFARRVKASPDRRLSAGVWFEVDEVRARVEVRVLDRAGEVIDRHPVAETEPLAWWYVPHLGTIRWLDPRTIELRTKGRTPTVLRVRDQELDTPG